MIEKQATDARSEKLRLRMATGLNWSIGALAALSLYFVAVSAWMPRLDASFEPTQIHADDGYAFTLGPGLQTHWPYMVPSHPDSVLSPGDVQLREDGELFGSLEPAHDIIRQLGGGRFNFWQGTIWFSTQDNTDPRSNGRTYTVQVQTRLSQSARTARLLSTASLIILILCRLGPVVIRHLGRVTYRLRKRLSIASRSRAGFGLIAKGIRACMAYVGRLAQWIPLTFGRTFALVSAAMLAAFSWQSLLRPMPLFFTSDSFGYVYPGLVLAMGRDLAGQSYRDLGYPALTLLATKLGSLSMLPRLQLFIAVAGLVCTLGVLYATLRGLASRLHTVSKVPSPVLALCAGAAAALYCMLMLNHDLFVIDIYSAMAETLHFLPAALALLLLVGGWTPGTPVRRLCFLSTALVVAYLSIMVKPHTSMVAALCGISLLIVGVRNLRAFRSPAVLAVCIASAGLVVAVHRLDAWAMPPGDDFGPKTLFCNHLDVVEPVFDTSTPQRARIMPLLRGVLQNPDRWAVMGYNGDLCFYNQAFTDAIVAAAKSEGLEVGPWQQREFLKAVLKNPVAYSRDVSRQLRYFLVHTIDDIKYSAKGSISEGDWKNLAPFAAVIRMSRSQFDTQVTNWVPTAYPALAPITKSLLQGVSDSFAPVAVGSTALALVVMVLSKSRIDLRPEITILVTAAFTMAFAMTTALAHTFDVGRYLTDILPFSVLWWVLGVAYVGHGLVLLSTLAVRGDACRPIVVDAGLSGGHDAQSRG